MKTNRNLPAAAGGPGLPGALPTGGGVGMPLDRPLRSGESSGHGNGPPREETEFGL